MDNYDCLECIHDDTRHDFKSVCSICERFDPSCRNQFHAIDHNECKHKNATLNSLTKDNVTIYLDFYCSDCDENFTKSFIIDWLLRFDPHEIFKIKAKLKASQSYIQRRLSAIGPLFKFSEKLNKNKECTTSDLENILDIISKLKDL